MIHTTHMRVDGQGVRNAAHGRRADMNTGSNTVIHTIAHRTLGTHATGETRLAGAILSLHSPTVIAVLIQNLLF